MEDISEEVKTGAGDAEKVKPQPPEPESPKVPDVELIVDGFGFMPKERYHSERRRSSTYEKTKLGPKKKVAQEENSSCASSTNIDVVRRYTWKTKNRMLVQVITYGATITSIVVPDKRGVPDDVLAGFDTLEEYFQPKNPYFGATIGRYANVIRDATMVVKPSGRMYMLSNNMGPHHYNGGYVGFDKVNWRSYVSGHKVIMTHVSERFHEGYPGTVMAQVTFEVTCDNSIKIEMKCQTSEPTIINLSNAHFFNLAGHNAGPELMLEHIVTINADKYTAIDENGLVTGERKVVGATAYDLRVPRLLRAMMPRIPMGGYDINFCITRGIDQDMAFQARVLHPITGRVLEVYSNQPGMQFYTGNLLPDPNKIIEEIPGENEETETAEKNSVDDSVEESLKENEEVSPNEYESDMSSVSSELSKLSEEGKGEESQGKRNVGYVPLMGKKGATYERHGLFCLMPQNYPDAINQKNFPNSVLNPGEVYVHKMQYKFGILIGKYV